MKKKLFYCVASWFAPPNPDGSKTTCIRHAPCAAQSEAEARGLAMAWLDRDYPEYKDGSKFNISVTQVPDSLVRECVG